MTVQRQKMTDENVQVFYRDRGVVIFALVLAAVAAAGFVFLLFYDPWPNRFGSHYMRLGLAAVLCVLAVISGLVLRGTRCLISPAEILVADILAVQPQVRKDAVELVIVQGNEYRFFSAFNAVKCLNVSEFQEPERLRETLEGWITGLRVLRNPPIQLERTGYPVSSIAIFLIHSTLYTLLYWERFALPWLLFTVLWGAGVSMVMALAELRSFRHETKCSWQLTLLGILMLYFLLWAGPARWSLDRLGYYFLPGLLGFFLVQALFYSRFQQLREIKYREYTLQAQPAPAPATE